MSTAATGHITSDNPCKIAEAWATMLRPAVKALRQRQAAGSGRVSASLRHTCGMGTRNVVTCCRGFLGAAFWTCVGKDASAADTVTITAEASRRLQCRLQCGEANALTWVAAFWKGLLLFFTCLAAFGSDCDKKRAIWEA